MRVSTASLPSGHVVEAKTGRDNGSWFLVVGTQTGSMVWLADGTSRPYDHPKKKNVRHVRDLGAPPDAETALERIAELNDSGARNAAVRAYIARHRETVEAQVQQRIVETKEEC
jgi:hypothetical protein